MNSPYAIVWTDDSVDVPQTYKVTVTVRVSETTIIAPGDNIIMLPKSALYVPPGYLGVARAPAETPTLVISPNFFAPSDDPLRSVFVYNRLCSTVMLLPQAVFCVVDIYRVKDMASVHCTARITLHPMHGIHLLDLDKPAAAQFFLLHNRRAAMRELNTFRIMLTAENLKASVLSEHDDCVACNSNVERFPFVHSHSPRYTLENSSNEDVHLVENQVVGYVCKLYHNLFNLVSRQIATVGAGPQMFIYADEPCAVPAGGVRDVCTTFVCEAPPKYFLKIHGLGVYESRVSTQVYKGGQLTVRLFNSTSKTEIVHTGVPLARAVVIKPCEWSGLPVRTLMAVKLTPGCMVAVPTDLQVNARRGTRWDICEDSRYNIEISAKLTRICTRGVELRVTNMGLEDIDLSTGTAFASAYRIYKNPLDCPP